MSGNCAVKVLSYYELLRTNRLYSSDLLLLRAILPHGIDSKRWPYANRNSDSPDFKPIRKREWAKTPLLDGHTAIV
jgi:hypothetical protein